MSPCWGSCLQCFGGRPKISAVTGLFVMTWVFQQGRHREVSLLPYWEQGCGKARDAYNGGQTLAPPTPPPPWWDLFSFTGVQSLQSLDPYSDRRVGWFLGSGEGQAAPSSHCLGGSTWVPPLQGTSFGGWPLSLQGLKISSLISFLYLTMHGLCH